MSQEDSGCIPYAWFYHQNKTSELSHIWFCIKHCYHVRLKVALALKTYGG